MIKLSNCPLCNSDDISVIKEYTYLKPRSNSYNSCENYTERRLWILFNHVCTAQEQLNFQLSHCQSCDFLFTNPRFEDKEIAKKYQVLVGLSSTEKEYKNKPLHNIDKRAKRIFNLVNRYVSKSSEKIEIADVGGQFGHNLKHFMSDTFKKYVVDYEKYDFYPDIEYLQPNWEIISTEFDIIITNHTVEHLSFPTNYLTELVSHLKNSGLLYIEVPLGAFREAYNIHEPITHFNFYSERSLLNQIFELGLTPLHIDTSYQWITDNAEHCLNIIAKKTDLEHKIDLNLVRGNIYASDDVKHKLRYYFPLILKKLLKKDLLAR
jgi:SAM-dependent methyltransferase